MADVTFRGFPAEAFEFYEGLQADNSKTYWTANKDVYERDVKAPMQALMETLAPDFGLGKLFRPYRDVRFSSDKSPYKTHQGVFCQTADAVGYYVHLDAEGVYVAGGFYSHTRDQTARYRSAVDDDKTGPQLVRITAALVKRGFGIGGDMVKTRPRGCPADHPRLELMRHESLTANRYLDPSPKLATAAGLELVRAQWTAMRPLMEWVMTNVGGGSDDD
jgi:uncharacterized protein (TIGR02453 family)